MNKILDQQKAESEGQTKSYSPLSSLFKALTLSGLLLGTSAAGIYFYSSSNISILPQHDTPLSQEQNAVILQAFNASPPMQLSLVPQKDITTAVQNMQLSPEAKQTLAADIGNATMAANVNATNPQAAANSAAAPEEEHLKLAWITLWDTDVEDGDVVRIDSQGYSRTVVLKKAPLTIAVPIPASGVVKVTGITDGDGGGITVGLASGSSKAVFPIMSVGQVLGLKVKVN